MSLDRAFLNLQIEFRGLSNKCQNLKTKINNNNYLISSMYDTYEDFKEKIDSELDTIEEKIECMKHQIGDLRDNIEEIQTEIKEALEKKTDEMNTLCNIVLFAYVCGIVVNFGVALIFKN